MSRPRGHERDSWDMCNEGTNLKREITDGICQDGEEILAGEGRGEGQALRD